MITNKDIRVENGFLIINGDKYPLGGQSPEAIMAIVKDNSDTTPTANSDDPVTSDGIKTYVDNIASGKADVITAPEGGTLQKINVGVSSANRIFLLSAGYVTRYTVGIVVINVTNELLYVPLSSAALTATLSYNNGELTISFDNNPYTRVVLIKLS